MTHNGIMALPTGVAKQLASRAKAGEGFRKHKDTEIVRFVNGSTISCLVSIDPPIGHMYRDAREAAEIRSAIENAAK